MPDTQKTLLSLASLCLSSAELLHDTVCNNCISCATQISDLNRNMLSELSDLERKCCELPSRTSTLRAAHALGECVTATFSAALLLPQTLPHIPPLEEEVTCIVQLAKFPEQLLTTLSGFDRFPFYSLHLCANKGRGAHALLLNNFIASDPTKALLPSAIALEALRNTLEHACGVLME